MIQHFGAHESRPLSSAVRAGEWLYVSGQASTDPETGAIIPGTFDEEFHRSIANLRRTILDSGGTMERIVRIGSFVRDEDDLPRYNELYLETFTHPRPARTTIAMGFSIIRFEIEAVVYLGDG